MMRSVALGDSQMLDDFEYVFVEQDVEGGGVGGEKIILEDEDDDVSMTYDRCEDMEFLLLGPTPTKCGPPSDDLSSVTSCESIEAMMMRDVSHHFEEAESGVTIVSEDEGEEDAEDEDEGPAVGASYLESVELHDEDVDLVPFDDEMVFKADLSEIDESDNEPSPTGNDDEEDDSSSDEEDKPTPSTKAPPRMAVVLELKPTVPTATANGGGTTKSRISNKKRRKKMKKIRKEAAAAAATAALAEMKAATADAASSSRKKTKPRPTKRASQRLAVTCAAETLARFHEEQRSLKPIRKERSASNYAC